MCTPKSSAMHRSFAGFSRLGAFLSRLTTVLLSLSALILLFSLSGCQADETAETQQSTQTAWKSTGYGVAKLVYLSPLSSRHYEKSDLQDQTRFQFNTSSSVFSACFDGVSADFVSPSYQRMAEKDAFITLAQQVADDPDSTVEHTYLNLSADPIALTPDSSAFLVDSYTEKEALRVYDRNGGDTGYTVYFLDDEMWVAYFADPQKASASDYIVKLNVS